MDSQPTVVVADDSPTLRRIVGSVLERDGFRVVLAEDGVEAVQAVFRTQPDAVILDVQMPRCSGFVAARVLKDDWQTKDIPVVILTSLDAATDRYQGRLVGADRFISKDFEAPQLIEAVRSLLRDADDGRGGRARLVPDPIELSDEDVYGRIGDMLDRKLFEAQVTSEVTAIAAEVVEGFEQTVASVLSVLGRVVDYDLAAVLMLDDYSTYVTVSRETSAAQYRDFFAAIADTATQVSGEFVEVAQLVPRVADPHGYLGADDEGTMSTFLSMPLKARGKVVGAMALSSATKNAFGETSLSTLELVESPAAMVIDNARLSGRVPFA